MSVNDTANDIWPPEIPPRKAMEALQAFDTEAELAADLLYEISDDYRYATDLGCWIMRDGPCWVPAPRGVTDVITEAVAMSEYNPAMAQDAQLRKWARQGFPGGRFQAVRNRETVTYTPDDVRRNDMLQRMQTPAGQARLAALMKNLAGIGNGDLIPLTADTGELDTEPHILWAGSVPFDLERSVTEPAWAEDDGGRWEMTYPHMLSAGYCPDISVPVPMWDKLTAAVFPDVNEREHALNALAHGLHGYPAPAAVLARSATGTGKSLLASLMSDLLGSYAGQVDAATLFGKGGSSQFAFDEMAGARFVVMSEGRKADFQSTEAFKHVVSPDPLVNARSRHEKHRRLVPARHTLFLTVNPAADLDYSDPAVVRRLIPAGFAGDRMEISRLASRYGTSSAEGLENWRAEAPGVLARMIVRCAYVLGDMIGRGTCLDAPESVMSRFGAVVADADPFGRWLAERTRTDVWHDARTPTGELLADYERWCQAEDIAAMAPVWFGRAMASAGIEPARWDHGTKRGWHISLRDQTTA